jgi:ribosome maturation factor RimP/uncharacterized protein YaiE (UPF0345 family)
MNVPYDTLDYDFPHLQLNKKQDALLLDGGPINTNVLSTFTIGGTEDNNDSTSLVSAKAIEDWFEHLQQSLVQVQVGQQGPSLRVGSISLTSPSSLNVPSCSAVSNFVSAKLSLYVTLSYLQSTYVTTSALDNRLPTDVSYAELSFLDGATSNLQNQLNGKQDIGSYLTDLHDKTLTGTTTLPTSVNVGSDTLDEYVDGRVGAYDFPHVDIGSSVRLKSSTSYHSPALVATNSSNIFQKIVCSELVIASTPLDSGQSLTSLLGGKLDLPSTTFSWPTGVTDTVLSYLDTTSSVQTQLDSKQAVGSYLTSSSDVSFSGTVGIPADSRIGGQSFNTYVDGRIQGHTFSYVDVGSARIQGSTSTLSPALVSTDSLNTCIPIVCSELVVATDIHSTGSTLTAILSNKHPKTTVDTSPTLTNITHLITSGGVAAKINSLTTVYHPLTAIDAVPTENNTTNLVTSHGVFNALDQKHPLTNVDSSVTPGSGNLVTCGAVHTAIQTSKTTLEALITALTARVAALEILNSNNGVTQQKYTGYYNDAYSTYFIDSRKDGSSSIVTSILLGDEGSNYSYMWTCTFVPSESGTYTFSTASDDASHVVVGTTVVVNNGGTHGTETEEGTISLNSGTSYDLSVYFGELNGGASMLFRYKTPSGSGFSSNLNNAMFAPS